MNTIRRNKIKKVIKTFTELSSIVSMLQEEEGNAMDAISENFSETSQYAKMEECYDLLGYAISGIEEVISNLEECIE